MTIREMETLSGMTRANIRFYEAEGLLCPERGQNGYRNYSEGDLEVLRRVRLLRLLRMPLEDIKALNTGGCQLTELLDRHIERLRQERETIDRSQKVCRAMREDGVSYRTFDPRPYLESFSGSGAELAADALPKVRSPWRRFFARALDMSIYSALWSLFLKLALNINLSGRSVGAALLDALIGLALMFIIEPALLSLFGTTAGKWIMGLRVTGEDGGRLTYSQAFSRVFDMFSCGMGYYIPIYRLICLWKSYKACGAGETLGWEDDSVLSLRDAKWWRGAALAGAYAALIVLLVLAELLAQMPKNRGDITAAEFCENYNRLSEYLNVDMGSLDARGRWEQEDDQPDDALYYVMGSYIEPPNFRITEENGAVTEISLELELDHPRSSVTNFQDQKLLAIMSYVWAQEDFSPLSGSRKRILKQLEAHPFDSFEFTEAGVKVSCVMEQEGYFEAPGSGAFVKMDGDEAYYYMSFRMEKELR